MLPAAVLLAADPPRTVRFANGYTLNAGRVEPAPPSDLAPAPEQSSNRSYLVVQCRGPLDYAWSEELARRGARTLGYLPQYALVVKSESARVAELESLDFVDWIAPFPPIAKLDQEVLGLASQARLLVVPFPEHDVDSLADVIARLGLSVASVAGRVVNIAADRAGAGLVAGLDAVEWVQLAGEACLFNNNVQWVVQTGWQPAVPPDSTGRRIWRKGIRGQGIVISLTDTGINVDHDMFADPQIPIRDAGIYLNHRKIIAYRLRDRGVFGDVSNHGYHGTGNCCTAAGNDEPNGNGSDLDGIAPEARIYFIDVGDGGGGIRPMDDMTTLFDSLYLAPGTGMLVPQTSLSWGQPVNNGSEYKIQDATSDASAWRYPELLIICGAGNDPRWISNPAVGKNVLTVGACGNSTWSDTLALFSGQGPAADGRIKPELLAPGVMIGSASGPGISDYDYADGTSLSAPAVNGACALIRQYLNEGWYPTGSPVPEHRMPHPSSALIRALAVVSTDPDIRNYTVPDPAIGWGRIDLDSALYFAGDSRRLVLFDETDGLATGEFRDYAVRVHASIPSIPLRACLAWTDTAAMPNAERTLVNDLDLIAFSPGGQYYHGNKYFLGQSSPTPIVFDSLNSLECFRVNKPDTSRGGVWLFRVVARNVFTRRQPYALVITGAGEALPGIAGKSSEPDRVEAELLGNPVAAQATLRCQLPTAEHVKIQVYDQSGRRVRTVVNSCLPSGSHELVWNLRNTAGNRVDAGVYFLDVVIGDQRFTRKLVVPH
jgi:subtilisin family serine protease